MNNSQPQNQTSGGLLVAATAVSDVVMTTASWIASTAAAAVIGTGSAPFSGLNIGYIAVGVVGIIGNLLACIVMIAHEPIRKRLANYFFINQCALDLVVHSAD